MNAMANAPCPVCRYLTLRDPDSPGDWCPVWGWERVLGSRYEIDHPDDEVVDGQPSLNQARLNFQLFGAVTEGWLSDVRPPLPLELPDS